MPTITTRAGWLQVAERKDSMDRYFDSVLEREYDRKAQKKELYATGGLSLPDPEKGETSSEP